MVQVVLAVKAVRACQRCQRCEQLLKAIKAALWAFNSCHSCWQFVTAVKAVDSLFALYQTKPSQSLSKISPSILLQWQEDFCEVKEVTSLEAAWFFELIWLKQSTPGSVVPLAMFFFSISGIGGPPFLWNLRKRFRPSWKLSPWYQVRDTKYSVRCEGGGVSAGSVWSWGVILVIRGLRPCTLLGNDHPLSTGSTAWCRGRVASHTHPSTRSTQARGEDQEGGGKEL